MSAIWSRGPRRWLWRLVVIVSSVVLGGLALNVGSLIGLRQVDAGRDNLTVGQIEQSAQLTLPASARNLESHALGFRDQQIYIRFELPAADLESFLALTAVERPLSQTEMPALIDIDLDRPWWTPSAAQRWQAGQGTGQRRSGAGYQQAVLIDMTDPQLYTVYLVTFLM